MKTRITTYEVKELSLDEMITILREKLELDKSYKAKFDIGSPYGMPYIAGVTFTKTTETK